MVKHMWYILNRLFLYFCLFFFFLYCLPFTSERFQRWLCLSCPVTPTLCGQYADMLKVITFPFQTSPGFSLLVFLSKDNLLFDLKTMNFWQTPIDFTVQRPFLLIVFHNNFWTHYSVTVYINCLCQHLFFQLHLCQILKIVMNYFIHHTYYYRDYIISLIFLIRAPLSPSFN